MHTPNLFFLGAMILLTSLQTYMMERETDDKALIIKDLHLPHSTEKIGALGNKHLLIKDNSSISVINTDTNSIELLITNQIMGIFSDEKKTAAIIAHKNKNKYFNTIYDIKTGKLYFIPEQYSTDCTFSFTNSANTITSATDTGTTTLYNYIDNTLEEYTLLNQIITQHNDIIPTSITHHPTESQVAFFTSDNTIYMYDILQQLCINKVKLDQFSIRYFGYIADGSCVLATHDYNTSKTYIFPTQPHKNSVQHLYLPDPCDFSNSCPYLAAILRVHKVTQATHTIDYWNIKKNIKIKEQSFQLLYKPDYNFGLSFFADDQSIAAFVGPACKLFKIPFDIINKKICQLGTTNRLIFLYFALKNVPIKNYEHTFLLPEIIQLLLQKTVKLARL